jgi:hypothetical protein
MPLSAVHTHGDPKSMVLAAMQGYSQAGHCLQRHGQSLLPAVSALTIHCSC